MSFKNSTAATTKNEVYDLYSNDSPRSSMDSNDLPQHKPIPHPPPPAIQPSIRLLFSFIPRHHLLILVLPAIFFSIIAGGVAPFMTYVVGEAFEAFAQFSTSTLPPEVAQANLLHSVGIVALQLVGLAVASLALSSITSALWISIGERNTLALRKAVYVAVSDKGLTWFDAHQGTVEGEEQDGAAGLMAKFSRETDEVRAGSSLASGMLVQNYTTVLTCLALAFVRSWQLTLVILSSLPLLIFAQGVSQRLSGPHLAYEREQVGVAATIIERAATAIGTVKAFNAANFEYSRAEGAFDRLHNVAYRINSLFAFTHGIGQFLAMSMFVQGFWFGSKLVREGHATSGDVMAVFWACLIAVNNLQMTIPQSILLNKGKIAMVALLTLVSPTPADLNVLPPGRIIPRPMKPAKCSGALALHNVTFAYPSRPTVPVLIDVSVFIPANDMTFIVGGSGSGKSTIAHLLQKLYEPQEGSITVDDWDMRSLDETWIRSHIGCVGQQGAAGVVILDGQSLFDNIAAAVQGHSPHPPTNAEVQEACQAALMHEFVRDLPDGYNTILGSNSGIGLSGGQKQRLSMARARLRNPTVLILDEATSSLDVTSRLLVFEAVKRWRYSKTTIVITHDLSQIQGQDFVYVMKEGRVVEQGYRSDLEASIASPYNTSRTSGDFRRMAASRHDALPKKKPSSANLRSQYERAAAPPDHRPRTPTTRPLTFGTWMFDVVADLTGSRFAPPSSALRSFTSLDSLRFSRSVPKDRYTTIPDRRRSSTTYVPPLIDIPTIPSPVETIHARRFTVQATPTSPGIQKKMKKLPSLPGVVEIDEKGKSALEHSADLTRNARHPPGSANRLRRGIQPNPNASLSYVKIEKSAYSDLAPVEENDEYAPPNLWAVARDAYRSIPRKRLLFLGLATCIASGAMTPVFSYLLSQLLVEVSIGAKSVSTINLFGGLVLAATALDGFFAGLKFMLMESSGTLWATSLRKKAFDRILLQDKKWFDRAVNAPHRLVQVLVKDADDARDLVSVVLGHFVQAGSMMLLGLVWAFARGWQLTLAGLAIAPVFATTMIVQTRLVAKCELRNKRAREEVAKGYYDTIINIRGIRSMAFDHVFKQQFDKAADKALKTGVRGAFAEGCTYGVASGLIYLAEALLFYVGALLIARGVYSYLQMIEALNLIVFSVAIGAQMLASTEKIAKCSQASHDFLRFTKLSTDTYESRGTLRPAIDGTIRFNNVNFNYPEQPDVPVLRQLNFKIKSGECVAIVGASGSGKSTIVSLLQRLYEPGMGSVTVGGIDTRLMDVEHLRDHLSVVSQHPHLFDATIKENIRYGRPSITSMDVLCAADSVHLHGFFAALPQGYDTPIGENASLLSGGQAQRLQIARALARPGDILVLDECTSSLDAENQQAILETVRSAKVGRTVVMVTHKLEAMRMCDRILVLKDGEVVEQGNFHALMEKKGVFATLARGGEWMGH